VKHSEDANIQQTAPVDYELLIRDASFFDNRHTVGWSQKGLDQLRRGDRALLHLKYCDGRELRMWVEIRELFGGRLIGIPTSNALSPVTPVSFRAEHVFGIYLAPVYASPRQPLSSERVLGPGAGCGHDNMREIRSEGGFYFRCSTCGARTQLSHPW
jgi:hypothetical protein